MEKPLAGLDDCLNMLQVCSSELISDLGLALLGPLAGAKGDPFAFRGHREPLVESGWQFNTIINSPENWPLKIAQKSTWRG